MESSSNLVKTATAKFPYLPPEIISEFLIRLPVKILRKLCCVSRQWHALITDPIFRASYRTRSEQNPLILLKYYNPDDHLVFSSLDYKDRKVDQIVRFDMANRGTDLSAVSCQLDLVCLYNYRSMYIWNPSTGEHIQLPEYLSTPKISCTWQEVAFGYCQLTAKYKILHVRFDFFHKDDTHCEVLTLGSDHQQWKETKGPPLGGYHYTSVTFHGAVYLIRIDRDISRFDLQREEWTSIEGPPMRRYTRLSLTELGGSLCMTECNKHLGTAIWFLEDYDKGIWVCKYNIDVTSVCGGVREVVSPLVIERDGRLVLHIHGTDALFCYEPRSKTFEAIYRLISDRGMLSARLYIQSFTSFKYS